MVALERTACNRNPVLPFAFWMKQMKHLTLLALAAGLAGAPAHAQSTCTCTCFDGRPQGVCTDPTEVPVCTPDICPPKSPILAPLPPRAKLEEVCKNEMVWNALIGGYEYRPVCRPQQPLK